MENGKWKMEDGLLYIDVDFHGSWAQKLLRPVDHNSSNHGAE
jgi:hypothetical protein